MRRLMVITDEEPTVKHFLNSWEMKSGRMEGDTLTVELREGTRMVIRSIDPQLVADVVFSHDPSSEIVKGRIGITSVRLAKAPPPPQEDAAAALAKALRRFLDEADRS